MLSTFFFLFGIPELPIELNKRELVPQLCVEVSSSVLNTSGLLWLALIREKLILINTAISRL